MLSQEEAVVAVIMVELEMVDMRVLAVPASSPECRGATPSRATEIQPRQVSPITTAASFSGMPVCQPEYNQGTVGYELVRWCLNPKKKQKMKNI